jgi:hypothetical protein
VMRERFGGRSGQGIGKRAFCYCNFLHTGLSTN